MAENPVSPTAQKKRRIKSIEKSTKEIGASLGAIARSDFARIRAISDEEWQAAIDGSELGEGDGPGRGWWGPPKGTHGKGKDSPVIAFKGEGWTKENRQKVTDVYESNINNYPQWVRDNAMVSNIELVAGSGESFVATDGTRFNEGGHYNYQEGSGVGTIRMYGADKHNDASFFAASGRKGMLDHEIGHGLYFNIGDKVYSYWKKWFADNPTFTGLSMPGRRPAEKSGSKIISNWDKFHLAWKKQDGVSDYSKAWWANGTGEASETFAEMTKMYFQWGKSSMTRILDDKTELRDSFYGMIAGLKEGE